MVNALARDRRGSLWLATNHGLYQRGVRGGWTNYAAESRLGVDHAAGGERVAFVTSFAEERNGRLWVAFHSGFGRIAVDPKPRTPVLDLIHTTQPGLGREARELWFGVDGRRWIATSMGLREWVITPNGVSRFREHTIQDKFPHEAVLCIREDIASNLWIGTRRSGLVRVGSSRFQTFGGTDGLQLGLDQLLIEEQSGQVSVFDVGGKRNQIYRQEGGQRFTAVLHALPDPVVSKPHVSQMAMQDHKGRWWFSTSAGLFRFPTLTRRSDLRLLSECSVDRFFEDSGGNIWASNWCHGDRLAKLARWERHSGLVDDESARLPLDAPFHDLARPYQ